MSFFERHIVALTVLVTVLAFLGVIIALMVK